MTDTRLKAISEKNAGAHITDAILFFWWWRNERIRARPKIKNSETHFVQLLVWKRKSSNSLWEVHLVSMSADIQWVDVRQWATHATTLLAWSNNQKFSGSGRRKWTLESITFILQHHRVKHKHPFAAWLMGHMYRHVGVLLTRTADMVPFTEIDLIESTNTSWDRMISVSETGC